MRLLLVLAMVLGLAGGSAIAQESAPPSDQEVIQESAKEYMDRLLREQASSTPEPAPAPEPVVTAPAPQDKKEVAVPQEDVPAAAEEKTAAPEPCKPEEKDFSDKAVSVAKKYERRQTEIDKMDSNCDGVLQSGEIRKGIDTRFVAADTDKDGVLSKEEAAAMVEEFKEEGQQEYGSLTDSSARKLETRLDKADKNNDGVITSDEYKKYYNDRYKKMDKNGDGALDVKEFQTDVERPKKPRN